MTLRRLAVALVALLIAGCGGPGGPAAVPIGAHPDDSLVAHLYAAALRYYGTPTRVQEMTDPLAGLDSAEVRVVPGFTGRLLHRFAPDAPARAAEQVYRDMVSALPEGIAAGDYTTSAEDKATVAVTEATADAWGARDMSALAGRCEEVVTGATADAVDGGDLPTALGQCRLPTPRVYPDAAALFAALRAGAIDAAWTTTAAVGVPSELVVLSDSTALVRAQNLVPLYRRNELTEAQVLALNQIAGVLDTAALVDMRRQVAEGADPADVAATWLDRNPPGR
ncbi:glycine betaine ABC transporter substrate-binding protein [Mycolicibacterium thermoresistibile]